LLRIFASGITGTASGKVNLSVAQNNIVLTGAVLAENGTMKINYLQTKYRMSDSVRFDRKGIMFNNVKVTDERGNLITVSGRVNHRNFKEFAADLTINANNCLVLNTKPKDNDLFYGTAYGSGVTTIKSGNNTLSFDISAKTGKNTKFYMPLNNRASVSDYSFVSFVDSTTNKDEADDTDNDKIKSPPLQTGFDLDFDLEVTSDAEAQLIFDSKVGDVMKGHGSGNLNITYNPKGEFRITGDYIVEDGDYLFTLGNILNKSFSVENGGKIMFNGDINNAEIDMKAIYKLKASLFPILQDENFKDRVPVECQLNLSGNLWNPVVGFNIYLPTADEKTRTYVRNAISTDEELSRQFLYLLVMNSFYADPSLGVAAVGSSSPSGTSAMTVTTFEMLSNQLSNWLSQISNDFDIGVVYRPGSGSKDINPQEVQVALSTQILNDKVVINGNFDVPLSGSSTQNTNQITGDFDAEVKITNKLNFKVFNRYNNPYSGKGVDYTQGLGIFFKQEFDRFSELFKKKQKSEMKKEKAITPKKK
jgi:TamB, inner membrane protein subunit of TAM complex